MDESLRARVAELTDRFTFRPGERISADADSFVQQYNHQYARKIEPAYFYWQFFEAPFPARCLFAWHGNQFAGCDGFRLLPICGQGNPLGALVVDSMVREEYRGIGLFARMEMELEREMTGIGGRFLYGFPNRSGYFPRTNQMGWTGLKPLTTYSKDIETAISPPDPMYVFEPKERWDSDADAICAAFVRAHPTLGLVRRDAAYLNWRFAGNPGHRYEMYEVLKAGRLFAYLILKTFQDPSTRVSVGDIVDLLWCEDNIEGLRSLLQFALHRFRKKMGVGQAVMWLQTNTVLDEIGRDLGFVSTDQSRYFCVRSLGERGTWWEDSTHWYLTLADSEIY